MAEEIIEIEKCIENNKNFLLSGGAGSGKTYSLVQVINLIKTKYKSKSIACITYTNVAAEEIKARILNNDNIIISTIHDFLWENIKNYQNEIKICLEELINEGRIKYKNPQIEKDFFRDLEIKYKEYIKLSNGIISHDEVIILANKMYEKYRILSAILKDKFDFILVDEYQDTNPMVIEILLNYIKVSDKKNIIGFFGDSMQSIYSDGIGDLNRYIEKGEVTQIYKQQNRRNPLKVINLANLLRTDGLIQEPSTDLKAPNMKDGIVKEGNIKFIYSNNEIEYREIKENNIFDNWNFSDSLNTKELDLTHNLIADKAGFKEIMQIYDKDPILQLKRDLSKEIEEDEIDEDKTFSEILNSYPNMLSKLQIIQNDENKNKLFEQVKNEPYREIKKMYFSKDSLIDDKKMTSEDIKEKGRKRDALIEHLFKIERNILLYENKMYNELIRKLDYKINSIEDKKEIAKKIEIIKDNSNKTIEEMIELADNLNLCKIDDKLNLFIQDNKYLYNRICKLKYEEVRNLFNYIEGFSPFSTQHKVKGAEFNNVLVILDNGKWNQYNFESLFTGVGNPNVLKRTQKIFYVCCTRAKENLVVYYNKPNPSVLEKAKEWFGEENVIKI